MYTLMYHNKRTHTDVTCVSGLFILDDPFGFL